VKSVDRGLFLLLRNQVRSRARQSSRLWKEYKRRRRASPGGRLSLPLWFSRLLWPLILVFTLPGITGRVGVTLLLAMLALYCSGTTFLRAAGLRNRLYWSNELLLALHYPLKDQQFFRWQVREWLVSHLPVFFLSAMAYLYVTIHSGSDVPPFARAMLSAITQTAIVITLSLAQLLWLPRIWTKPVLAFYASLVCIFSFPTQFASLGGNALFFLPATWVNLWFAAPHSWRSDSVFLLIPLGLLAAADAWLVRSLEKTYPRTELTLVLQHAFQEQALEDETPTSQRDESVATFGRDYAVARERLASLHNRTILEGELTNSGFNWTAGHWTTRLAGHWLTPRQRVVAEFLSANSIDTWKGRWKLAIQLTAVGILLCLVPFAVPLWLSLCVFIAAAFTGAPLLGGRWPGLAPGWFGFARLQPSAGYPIGYTEASLSMMKVNAARLFGFIPIAVAAGLFIGWRYFGEPLTGVLVGAQVVLASFAVQPYCSLFHHSVGTNDTKRLNWTSVLLACALVANVVFFIPAAIFFFAFNRFLLAWTVGPILLFLLSFSMWRFYGFLYGRRSIDLLALSR
jgi:hypothetical protein